MALRGKQGRFVEEYLVDLNATQAAIRAGYSRKTAYSIGQENLKKPEIQWSIQKRQEELGEKLEITQERVLAELAAIAFADASAFSAISPSGRVELTPTEKLTPAQRRAVAAVKETQTGVEVKTYDKLRALELLGKHLGVFEGKAAGERTVENNLLAVLDGMEEEVEIGAVPETQPAAEAGDALVERP